MTVEAIKSLYDAVPFRPFSVCLVDGRKIKVPRAERLAIQKSNESIAVAHNDSLEIIDLRTVVRLEIPGRASAR
jgi:hypothetical protein